MCVFMEILQNSQGPLLAAQQWVTFSEDTYE